MKKFSLLTATLLTVTCIGSSALTANAASFDYSQITKNGNGIIISYGSSCDKTTLAEQIRNCLQNIFQNCPNNQPGTNKPETSLPETDKPEDNIPDANKPENSVPDTDKPENNVPETDKPESSAPETDKPENNLPETDKPENNAPDADKPENNIPDTDKPENDAPEQTTPDDSTSEDEAVLSYINQVVSLVNAERAKAGLKALTIDTKLQAAAQVRAMEIETSFSHTRPNGTSFATAIKEQNISYRSAGENIAWGQRSPQEVVSAWMNSSGHRANILNANFTKIGVGYQQNSRGVNYWSQLFIN